MTNYQPKHILVTGGAGFIGSHFIHFLLQHDQTISIINLDKLTYAGSLDNLRGLTDNQRYHFIQGDILDKPLVQHILHHHAIDTIIHFAAESHVDRSIHTPALFLETNILGTQTLLDCARHYWLNIEKLDAHQCRFHHISTDEVYGSLDKNGAPFTEQTPYAPRSPYAASKAGSDQLVRAYHHTYGLPITISNCSNNYGPKQHAEKFIPTIIRACLAKESIPLYGKGENIRDWLYVKDHCHGVWAVVTQGENGESYNLGGNNEWKNLALAEYICAEMDKILPWQRAYANLIEFVNDRPGHDFRYAINSTKAKKQLQWEAKTDFQQGMSETIKSLLL